MNSSLVQGCGSRTMNIINCPLQFAYLWNTRMANFLNTPTLLVVAAIIFPTPQGLHCFRDACSPFYHAKYLMIATLVWISGVDAAKGTKCYIYRQFCVWESVLYVCLIVFLFGISCFSVQGWDECIHLVNWENADLVETLFPNTSNWL